MKVGKKYISFVCILFLITACLNGTGKKAGTVQADDTDYTRLTFSDFGVADQTFEGGTAGVSGTAASAISTLDQTIISGKITLSKHVDEHLMIGGASDTASYYSDHAGIIISQAGNGQMIVKSRYDGKDGAVHYLFDSQNEILKGGVVAEGEISFRVQLDYEGKNVRVTLTLDDGKTVITDSATVEDIADKMTTNLVFNPWVSACSIASVGQDVEYTELTFRDLGIADGELSAYGNQAGTLPDTVASWSNIRFDGKITLPAAAGDDAALLLFGGVKDTENWNNPYGAQRGIGLHFAGNAVHLRYAYGETGEKKPYENLITKEELSNAGITYPGQEIQVGVAFKQSGSGATVITVTVAQGEKSVSKEAPLTGVAEYMTKNFVISTFCANVGVSYASTGASEKPEKPVIPDTPDDPDREYKTLTWKDFGIAGQSFGGGTAGVKGTAPKKVKTLDGVIFSGQIRISYHLDEHLLIGGSSDASDYYADSPGVILSQAGDGMLIIRSQFRGVKSAEQILFSKETPAGKGINMLGDVIRFQMQFDYIGNDVQVTVTLSNGKVSLTDSAVLTGIASEMTTNVAFNPWLSACRIASDGENMDGESSSQKEPAEISKFKELTFDTFRIKDDDYKNNIIYGQPLSYVKNLDKVAFSGYVTLAKEASAIRIGCTTDSLEGLILSYDAAKKALVLADGTSAGRGNLFEISEKDAGVRFTEKELKFRITLDYYGEGNVRIHLYVNDVSYGKVVLPMYASYLHNNVILIAGTHIGVRSVKGAVTYELTEWERFIRSKVDFSYFGFTDNWDVEMNAGI